MVVIMRILVPTAGPVPAEENVDQITEIAKRFEADLAVIHILDLGEYDEGRKALDIFDQAGREMNIHVDTYIREGNIVPTIVEFIDELDVDLVIMGASSGQLVADWIVSQILESVSVPVVIIPYMLSSDTSDK